MRTIDIKSLLITDANINALREAKNMKPYRIVLYVEDESGNIVDSATVEKDFIAYNDDEAQLIAEGIYKDSYHPYYGFFELDENGDPK